MDTKGRHELRGGSRGRRGARRIGALLTGLGVGLLVVPGDWSRAGALPKPVDADVVSARDLAVFRTRAVEDAPAAPTETTPRVASVEARDSSTRVPGVKSLINVGQATGTWDPITGAKEAITDCQKRFLARFGLHLHVHQAKASGLPGSSCPNTSCR